MLTFMTSNDSRTAIKYKILIDRRKKHTHTQHSASMVAHRNWLKWLRRSPWDCGGDATDEDSYSIAMRSPAIGTSCDFLAFSKVNDCQTV